MGLVAVFLYNEQRFGKLEEQLEAQAHQGSARENQDALTEEADSLSVSDEDQTGAFSLIGATFGFVVDEQGIIKTARLDWMAGVKVQEIRILTDQRVTLIAITSKEENVSIPPPYVVGSIPEGFVVKEGQGFETLAEGKTYRAELKGMVDGESFDVAFDFNIPEILNP
ncbi:MAG: hypothetical protein A3A30_04385 [Candidatus Terrybacteria bacterium RIFCSPLOWO2_01_FULL_48_14]|nr:MAG: hypothetical protein A3A30_04385 [Candidatus Terrybacteria bacterium RIFCSPLOWO2_01_FULL_48_14]